MKGSERVRFPGADRTQWRDYAELARIGHVTRARISQIMNLLNLAPDIQEQLLFLPRVTEGKDPITERELREIVAEVRWKKQQGMWQELQTSCRG